jgi:hypothetical protein
MRFSTTLHFDAPDYPSAMKLTAKILRENPGVVGTGVQEVHRDDSSIIKPHSDSVIPTREMEAYTTTGLTAINSQYRGFTEAYEADEQQEVNA